MKGRAVNRRRISTLAGVNRARDRETGQILVVFTIFLAVLILVTALVIDGGYVFLNRRDTQNASDIGALAGTKRLADYYVKGTGFTAQDSVYTAVSTRMTQNGCNAPDCTWTARYVASRVGSTFTDLGPVQSTDTAPPGAVSGTKALGVQVDLTKTPRTFLLGIIGQNSWTVQTTATAIAGKATGAPSGQLLPIALVSPPTMTEGSVYAITSGANGPGNFGWLSWTGSNDPNALATSICTPNNPGFTLPVQYPGDPGKSNASDVRACLQQWVDSGATVLIPIVLKTNDPANTPGCSTGGNGNGFTYCIVGIAAFVITGFTQPAVDVISGRFVGTAPYSIGDSVPGGINAPPTSGSPFYFIGLAK